MTTNTDGDVGNSKVLGAPRLESALKWTTPRVYEYHEQCVTAVNRAEEQAKANQPAATAPNIPERAPPEPEAKRKRPHKPRAPKTTQANTPPTAAPACQLSEQGEP